MKQVLKKFYEPRIGERFGVIYKGNLKFYVCLNCTCQYSDCEHCDLCKMSYGYGKAMAGAMIRMNRIMCHGNMRLDKTYATFSKITDPRKNYPGTVIVDLDNNQDGSSDYSNSEF